MPTPITADTAIYAPVSAGELLDKISILEIKKARIRDPRRLSLVGDELARLVEIRTRNITDGPELNAAYRELYEVNARLWDVEDALRERERDGRFDADFVELARSVYITNDRRSEIKLFINTLLGSTIVEVKSYADSGLGSSGSAPFDTAD